MKKSNFFKFLVIGVGFASASCTDLNEDLKDTITPDKFFRNQTEIDAAVLAPYTNLYGQFGNGGFWTAGEVTTDEAMIPQRGGDWFDGGQPAGLHTHVYKETYDVVNNVWNAAFSGISSCNRLLSTPEITDKTTIAELKVLRAYYYWVVMDNFGNVPLSTKLGENQGQKKASEIYAFIDSELTANVPLLSKVLNYGRLNYYAGQAIMAKLYINAKVYSGQEQLDKAIAACDEIINSGLYSIDPNYAGIFATINDKNTEHIWAVPFDHLKAKGFNLPNMTLHYSSQATYNLQQQPWNGYCSLEEFYNSYDATDKRKKNNFIVGPQYKPDGVTPITDDSYEKADSGDPSKQVDPDGANVVFTPQVNQLAPNALRQAGARIGKFAFAQGSTPDLDNDFPLYRYSDIVLTKAEALFRKNGYGDGVALTLTNLIHTRAGLNAYASINEDEFLAERGREMFAEMWRRNDLIRFGKYGKVWFGKTAADAADGHLNIFPIPVSQINANAGTATPLTQNPGY